MREHKGTRKQGMLARLKKHNNGVVKTWIYIYLACIAFIIITKVMPIIADEYIDSIRSDMDNEYTYHLQFSQEGYQEHYYVERWDTGYFGIVDLTYHTPTHTLDVTTSNIKVLGIDSRSLYEDKCEDVTGRSPYEDSNLYKKYFIERDLFTVNIVTADYAPIQNLSFKDVPIAAEVWVNDELWNEGGGYHYTSNYGMVIGNVPPGTTQVQIYFQSSGNDGPIAIVEQDVIYAEVGEVITFDASSSYDDEGIEYYYWDFGEGNFSCGVSPTTSFSYQEEGEYSVILTVRDGDSLIDRAYITVNVTPYSGNHAPTFLDVVPNQEKFENSLPWILDLGGYGSDFEDSKDELKWYITGKNSSLYYTVGENVSSVLTFIPSASNSGYDEVTLWLEDTNGAKISQTLWINLTPVNDKPVFYQVPPDLTITKDVPYTFNYEPYIKDNDNNINELTITTDDPDHTSVNGLLVTYNYPSSMVGQHVFVTLTVSDGIDSTSEVIQINITDDLVPMLAKELPDVTIYEGNISYNVFDLDDYFYDPDGDAVYFTYGYTHINIIINKDHTVDFYASSNWFGEEIVTFRARDPSYAIAEDMIKVTVLPVNDPPEISGVPDLVVHYNASYRFDLTPYISDTDNEITELSLSFMEFFDNKWRPSPYIEISDDYNLEMVVNYPEVFNTMTFQIRIVVSDGINAALDIIKITISEDWPPELVMNIPDVIFFEDEHKYNAFNVHNYFADRDGDNLYYTYGQVHVQIVINNNGSIDFSADENWYGIENITIRATDPDGALAEDIITITVLPVNDAPVIFTIPDQVGVKDEIWILDLRSYLHDVDNNITELEIICSSEYVTVAGTVLILMYPMEVNEELVQIIVKDPGDLNATVAFNVTLKEPIIAAKSEMDYTKYILTIMLIVMILATILLLYAYQKGKYEVEELFLVYGKSGILMSYRFKGGEGKENRDIMAGMFTAVQDFVSDVFDSERKRGSHLKVMELDDKKVMIERGDFIYLAAVFQGGTWRLASKVRSTVSKLESENSELLKSWDGITDGLEFIHEQLDDLLK